MNRVFRRAAALGALVVCVVGAGAARAQSAADFSGASYQQNFDGMGQGNISVSDAAFIVKGLISNKDDLAASTGNLNPGAMYNFGTTGAPVDRALGSIAANNTGINLFGLVLQNNTGATITNFNLSYVGEQYRNGGTTTSQKLDFSYIVSNTLAASYDFYTPPSGPYTDADALDFTSPITGPSSATLNGNLAANRRLLSATSLSTVNATTSPSGWLNGQYLYLRWTDAVDATNSHGLAIDEVNLTVDVPEPGTFSLMLLGAGPLFALARHRRFPVTSKNRRKED